MLPSGPLRVEHRLVLRMLALFRRELERIEQLHRTDPLFLALATDFVWTYCHRTHEGKEEDILFRDLADKPMADEHIRIMQELIDEHAFARQVTWELAEANSRYRAGGDPMALGTIIDELRMLVDFYPRHFHKEEEVFFPAAMTYLSEDEKQSMLVEYEEFDRRMIHEKYRTLVESLEMDVKGQL